LTLWEGSVNEEEMNSSEWNQQRMEEMKQRVADLISEGILPPIPASLLED